MLLFAEVQPVASHQAISVASRALGLREQSPLKFSGCSEAPDHTVKTSKFVDECNSRMKWPSQITSGGARDVGLEAQPASIVPVLNVSSRIFWLELDDKALLDSYSVLQEGILYDVFSQKCSAAWQGARGERLTVGIMLPGRQDADDWLNFMLSQKNLWPTFTTRGTLIEEISDQVFSKERRRLEARHLWTTVGGACRPDVRQSPHREVQKRTGCSALRQGRQTQPH